MRSKATVIFPRAFFLFFYAGYNKHHTRKKKLWPKGGKCIHKANNLIFVWNGRNRRKIEKHEKAEKRNIKTSKNRIVERIAARACWSDILWRHIITHWSVQTHLCALCVAHLNFVCCVVEGLNLAVAGSNPTQTALSLDTSCSPRIAH